MQKQEFVFRKENLTSPITMGLFSLIVYAQARDWLGFRQSTSKKTYHCRFNQFDCIAQG
jgi:hypothetical protein